MSLALETRIGGSRWLWACAGSVALLAGEPVAAAPLPCAGMEAQVVRHANQHRLLLCEQGHPAAEYRVALGRGGTGKQHEGNLKTPLGVYPLGPARTSAEFGLFLPVGCPTDEQRKHGFTGGDIGIHGPKRGFRGLGSLTPLSDWGTPATVQTRRTARCSTCRHLGRPVDPTPKR